MAQLPQIEQCFASSSVEVINARLASSPGQWPSATLAAMHKCAPLHILYHHPQPHPATSPSILSPHKDMLGLTAGHSTVRSAYFSLVSQLRNCALRPQLVQRHNDGGDVMPLAVLRQGVTAVTEGDPASAAGGPRGAPGALPADGEPYRDAHGVWAIRFLRRGSSHAHRPGQPAPLGPCQPRRGALCRE